MPLLCCFTSHYLRLIYTLLFKKNIGCCSCLCLIIHTFSICDDWNENKVCREKQLHRKLGIRHILKHDSEHISNWHDLDNKESKELCPGVFTFRASRNLKFMQQFCGSNFDPIDLLYKLVVIPIDFAGAFCLLKLKSEHIRYSGTIRSTWFFFVSREHIRYMVTEALVIFFCSDDYKILFVLFN